MGQEEDVSTTKFGIMGKMVLAGIAVAVMAGTAVPRLDAQAKADEAAPAYKNASLPIEQRVKDLVSRMTLDEKVRQMQHTAPAIPRLGVPPYDWWSEALHGVGRAGYATVFPQAIGMAATWDPNLVRNEGRVIAVEGRAKYYEAQREKNYFNYFGLTYWSPNINIFRDPRWGRGQETYGEDPFLTGKMGTAFVKGVQGDDPHYFEAIATPKHYAVHSGPEMARHGFDAQPSAHDLEDTYLPAFRETVVEGHAGSIMGAYNAVDGAPASANPYLLTKTLRQDWKFPGYIVSDCGAVEDIVAGHKFAPDIEHASVLAVRAGTDNTCGQEYVTLVQAVKDGLIKESELDTSLVRLFTARFRLGMFDPPGTGPYANIPVSQIDSPEHRRLAMQAARESMVLLKNQNRILPLNASVKTLAVIGPNAELLNSLEGNYNGTPPRPVLPLDGIRKQFKGKAEVLYAQGSPFVTELPVPVPRTAFQTSGTPAVEGLKAEYFAKAEFTGKPALTRTDPSIQFDWSAASPAPGIPKQAFAVRWTGEIVPPGPGDYAFSFQQPFCWPCTSVHTVKVYLDDKLVSSADQVNHDKEIPPFTAHFDGPSPHTLRMEYTHVGPIFHAGITLVWKPPVEVMRQEAVKVAQRADVVLAFIGLSPDLEGEENSGMHVEGFSGGDRTDVALPRAQQDLLEALGATGKPIVAVVMNGSAVAVNWAEHNANAILDAWYPGEEGGTAIAETLAGVNNPGGRLPVTFYASLDQIPPFLDYSMAGRTYRYFDGTPLYGFGYGLSYTTFDYSGLKLSSSQIKAGDPLKLEVDVRNTGKTAGDEVAEVYLSKNADVPAHLIRTLRGFERFHLAAGQSKHVTFTLSARDLSLVTEQGDHAVLPGGYKIFVGSNQPGDGVRGAEADLEIIGEAKLPR
jgi:beta-glucosidase